MAPACSMGDRLRRSRHHGMSNSYTIAFVTPACCRTSTTGSVLPGVSGSSSPRGIESPRLGLVLLQQVTFISKVKARVRLPCDALVVFVWHGFVIPQC